MKVIEIVPITQSKSVVVARVCDVCNKRHEGEDTPEDWHTFKHEHHSWSSSDDSFERHEVCSVECYWIKFKECVVTLKSVNQGKVDNFDLFFARKLVGL